MEMYPGVKLTVILTGDEAETLLYDLKREAKYLPEDSIERTIIEKIRAAAREAGTSIYEG